ncbi:MAG TPA: hypothetical protein DCL35_07120 [Candidatus Omnitrophica bacterium]|nr:hypothetical protein [Candidatus Omnitrophota bacterium]
MDSDQKTFIESTIDELASSLVLLDFCSSDEITGFKDRVRQLRQIAQEFGAAALAEAAGLLASTLDSALAAGESKTRKLVACWISVIQAYLKGGEAYAGDPTSLARHLSAQFSQVLSDEALPGSFLQPSSLREAVENGLNILSDIEKSLLLIEKDPCAKEALNELFRFFHTLKGEAGLSGMKNILRLAHASEDILEKLRDGRYKVDSDMIALFLSVKDTLEKVLRLYLTDVKAASDYDVSGADAQLKCFTQVAQSADKQNPPVLDLSEGPDLLFEFVTEAGDHLEAAENALMEMENSPDQAEGINRIFRSFHTIKGVASFLSLEDIRSLSHETETMMDYVRSGRLALDETIAGNVFRAIDALRKLLALLKEQVSNNGVLKSPYQVPPVIDDIRAVIKSVTQPKDKALPKKLGDILIEKDIIDEQELSRALKEQKEAAGEKKIGEILVDIGAATKEQISRGLNEQKAAVVSGESIKIAIRKLDDLVDTMGELVITGTQVMHHPGIALCEDKRLSKDIAQLDRIIRDIQNISMSMRLVPIKPVFQKMARQVRDLCVKSGKKIEIEMSGEETEIDKNITELISDPLVHMIRNAVDHGIEPPDLRRAAGKPETGRISLDAYHKGGNIMVEISDDGAGLNKEKILKKAVERGLALEGASYDDERIYHFIFEPGFSTADKVTDVSGRGVGMDVVKRNIEQLQGRIEIGSKLGEGTKFSIRLPLTLAIIEGIVVKVGDERYILPIFIVEEFFQPRTEDITLVAGQNELIKIHGQMSPLVRMDRYFNSSYKSTNVEELTGCLVSSDYGRLCFLFDELVGQQQIVIKNLGSYLKDVRGVSGATILGDGRVGLILDVNSIAAFYKA